MVFSTNQARQLYVATAVGNSSIGSIDVKYDNQKTHLYFEYVGQGGPTRSDLIDIKNIMYAKATNASKMARKLKAVTVTLDGDLVGGQDYILKIAFRQFAGISDEYTYSKFGMVHATKNMSASDFYKELALSLVKNFSRDSSNLVKFSLVIDAETDPVPVNAGTKEATLTGIYTGLLIEEVEQDWVLGTKAQVPVYFDVIPGTIIDEGEEVTWGKVEDAESAASVNNGKNIADLEYFCMGERADQYRGIGWPNVVPTKYMVDPSKAYHTLDIHYAYVDSNESVQKSEKDITIVCDDPAVLTNIINKVKTATGLTIASLT